MSKINRKKLFILIGFVCCLAGGGIWFMNYNSSIAEVPYEITSIAMQYAFDHDDLEYYMRDVDYVFAGSIEKLMGTVYKDKDIINGEKVPGTPYTKLKAKVTHVYKGEAIKGDTIQLLKLGGVTEDGRYYYLCEDDIIPEQGKEYIFLGYVQENGELLVIGKNSTIEKTNTNLTKKLEKALPAVEKKGNTEGERYTLDEKYKNKK